MTGAFVLLGIILLALFGIMALNRFRRPDYTDIEVRAAPHPLPVAGPELRIGTWNIGYGALGAGADIYMDGGTSLRALSKHQISAASKAIANQIAQTACDVMCLQEVAEPGFLTRKIDVRAQIDHALPDRQRYYWADFNTVALPCMLRVRHGMATYAGIQSDRCRIIDLPDGDTQMLGFIKKPYVGVLNRFPLMNSDKSWVVINIHLPVFNITHAARAAHLARLFDVAMQEYQQGNFVVICGDWNTRLCPTSFPHQIDEKGLKDFVDFPQDSLPTGWTISVDPKTPTVRMLDHEFEQVRTYTTIFDGFVVSPNVRIASVDTLDLGFAHSDHQPVVARVFAQPETGAV